MVPRGVTQANQRNRASGTAMGQDMAEVDFDEFDGGYDMPPAGNGRRRNWVNIAGAVTSVALLIGAGIWGYRIAVRNVMGVPVIHAMEGPMRIAPENPGGEQAEHQGLSVNDVAAVVNADPVTGDLLKIVYPPNYNVSMAERLIPAADLSEQISTAGKEASGTGNMKFMMNGAPTIGTLDGANVEILQEVGAENFFLFGLTAEEVIKRREDPEHSRKAIEASQPLQDVLQMIAEGRFSPDEPGRYHGLVHRVWHHDYFLVSSDFDAFHAAQAEVDRYRWDIVLGEG